MIRLAVRFAAEFVVLPPDNNSSGLCFPQVLPTNTGIDIADPLAGFDVVSLEIRYVRKEQFRTVMVLHDETYKG